MTRYDYLIAGGGMVAGYAVKELIARGVEGNRVGVVALDREPPYERPPLSKDFLRGETNAEAILISPADFYDGHGVGLHRQTRVMHVHPVEKVLVTDAGGFEYANLLLATGAAPRTLDVPGADLKGIDTLRSMDDARTIHRAAQGIPDRHGGC